MSATRAYVANFSPTLHVDRVGEGPDICSFCQKLPTPPHKTMPPKKTKRLAGARATANEDAGDAAAAPADAAAPPIKPYFGANGEATSRATSLPH